MSGKKQKNLPPVLERYELKYHISPEMIEPISHFVSAYCSPDKYSERTETGFYRITNLYLDSPDFRFLQLRKERAENRFNMRVRAYGDSPGLPYFLEIKQKLGDIIRKFRASVTDKEWYRAYTEAGYQSATEEGGAQAENNRSLFERLIYSYRAGPKVLTQYVRKAWVSDVDDYARVTFDIDLRYRPESDFRIEAPEEDMIACDTALVFDPGCSVILELKCYTLNVPLWMIDLIKTFNLQRRSFSKYRAGVEEVIRFYNYDYQSRVTVMQ